MHIRILRLLAGRINLEQTLIQRATLAAADLQDAVTPLDANVLPPAAPQEKLIAAQHLGRIAPWFLLICPPACACALQNVEFVKP